MKRDKLALLIASRGAELIYGTPDWEPKAREAVEALGLEWPQIERRDDQRADGAHYTPRSITKGMVKAALRPLKSTESPTVLDPACGCGAFLLEALRRLSGAPETRKDFLHLIHGSDINADSVALAKLALMIFADVSDLPQDNFQVGDALLDVRWPGTFDVVVGNPPYLGGNRISTVLGTEYQRHLMSRYRQSNGGADLASLFLLRGFELARIGGTVGLITTNTISQGATRKGGLQWVCKNGGLIYEAHTDLPWPGSATVTVSIAHVLKQPIEKAVPIKMTMDELFGW
jgi:hypothetical protein